MANSDIQQFSFGDDIMLGLGTDVTSATDLLYTLSSPTDIIYRIPTIGTIDITSSDNVITFLANQYLTYTTILGDIDISGIWKLQGTLTISGNVRLSMVGSFCVLESLPEQLL